MRNAFAMLFVFVSAAAPSSGDSEVYTRQTIPETPRNFQRALDATYKLEMMGSGGLCTGVALSPDGYVLTNLHCVMPCLADNDLVSRPYFNPLMGTEVHRGIVDVKSHKRYRTEQAVVVGDGSTVDVMREELDYRLTTVREQAPKGVSCPGYSLALGAEFYDMPMMHREQYFYGARVVWLGRSSMTFNDEHVSEFPARLIRKLREGQDDFAILKFDLPEPVACMPVSHARAGTGDRVWVVGYPMQAVRDSGLHSPGASKAVSFGSVRGTVAEDPVLRNQVELSDSVTGEPEPKIQLTVSDWLRLESIYENPDTLLTDLDAMPGNSGSAIIDRNGAPVALLHSGIAYSTRKYLGATVSGLRIGNILDEVRRGLGERKFGEIFSCPAASSGE